ncbi:hypothetical protein [Acidithiobacillus acidisediminis]|nr:hypothetical protein [Acidithiobacillus sp. S30A2]
MNTRLLLLRAALLLFSCGLTELGALAATRAAANEVAGVEYVVLKRLEKS